MFGKQVKVSKTSRHAVAATFGATNHFGACAKRQVGRFFSFFLLNGTQYSTGYSSLQMGDAYAMITNSCLETASISIYIADKKEMSMTQ